MAHRFPPGPNDHLLGMRTMSRMKADILGTYSDLHATYGDSVSFRTGPYRIFFFFHPDQVREVLVTHSKSMIRLPRVMRTLAQWNGDSLVITEGEQWIRQRRLVQQGFQPRRLETYGSTMVACARQLVESWHTTMMRDGHIDVDIDEAMTALTLSIICKTMFDSDVADVSAEIADAVSVLGEVAFREMQAPVRLPLWLPTRYNRQKRWAMNVVDDVVWRFVNQRRQEGSDHGDLLSMLLAAVDEDSGGTQLNDRQVRNEAVTLMMAGHDTTAAALGWLWYNLARFPEIARRCQAEVDEVVGTRPAQASDVGCLKYLVATIKETLRLYPPAVSIFLRQATTDLVIGGFDVPRRSLVMVSPFITQRDRRWFPKPGQFDPERFLHDCGDQILAGAYFPFGAGPRVCIGQSFAMTEIVLVAASVLQVCDVTTIPGALAPTLDVTMALRPREKLTLRWTVREPPTTCSTVELGSARPDQAG